MQEGRGFERTLPSPYDHHLLSPEQTQIAMLGGMRRKGRRQVFKYCRTPGKGANPASDYYVSRIEGSAIVQCELESYCIFLDEPHLPPIHIRRCAVLEPTTIIDEAI